MNAVVLLFTLCVIAQPVSCIHERVPFVEGMTLSTCQVTAQEVIAEWMTDHGHDVEDFAPVQWRCVSSDNEGESNL